MGLFNNKQVAINLMQKFIVFLKHFLMNSNPLCGSLNMLIFAVSFRF